MYAASIGQEHDLSFLTFAAALRLKKMGACRMALCFPEYVHCELCGAS